MNDAVLVILKDLTVVCDPDSDIELLTAALLRACVDAGGSLQRVLEHFKRIKVDHSGPTDPPLVVI